MNKDNIIKDIIFLPERFSEGKNSIYSLLKASGYFEMHSQINEEDIFERLSRHSECVEKWLVFSENKRVDSGRYFKKNDDNTYVVGYFSGRTNRKITEYIDNVRACAAFIKKEIEDLRSS